MDKRRTNSTIEDAPRIFCTQYSSSLSRGACTDRVIWIKRNTRLTNMPSTKKNSKKSKCLVEEAAIYSEDIGTLGIKTNCGSASTYHKPISSLPLAKDEAKRRLERMVGTCWLVSPGLCILLSYGLLPSLLGALWSPYKWSTKENVHIAVIWTYKWEDSK